MIAAVCWVPRGATKPVPEAIEPPSPEELQALLRLHGHTSASSADEEDMVDQNEESEIESSSMAVATALNAARALGCEARKANVDKGLDEVAAGLAELDMDNYDNEDEGIELFGNGGLGAAYYSSNDVDPYLVEKDSDDEEEIEDMTIKPSDLLILTARNEDDVSHLEVWIYEDLTEDGTQNMYVHHDVMLPAFPLSLAWLDCDLKGGDKGNYVAIGTMQPEIEIWDLDVLDAVEPAIVLGGFRQSSSSKSHSEKKKKKKGAKLKEGSHSDAVLCLAWNNEYRNVLASGSADSSIKIWDIVTQKCEHTISSHSDKVQAVAWNKQEPTVLLSGAFDHTLLLMDMRAPAHDGVRWSVSADVESLAWDPHTSHSFVVSLEDGIVSGHDIRMVSPASASGSPRKGGKPLFNIHAHDKAVCTVSYNTAAPHLLATGSTDKMVKLWDLKDNQPSCLCSKNPKVGAVFASAFCKDAPFLLAVGGSKGNLDVWDTMTEAEIARRFGRFRTPKNSKESR
ncbi:hypothetical protein GOP47_0019683 [Adiantum capillus-veneris]|uniref:Uncharacterized protein n=1 Tax=Adiantum capillus-veneris TaxID=13818 RepID=A0A9D4Z7A3_ADICA|nr:hypothetical protein GOP47_0019683 [Adiantum capillus-veneris]